MCILPRHWYLRAVIQKQGYPDSIGTRVAFFILSGQQLEDSASTICSLSQVHETWLNVSYMLGSMLGSGEPQKASPYLQEASNLLRFQ